MTLWAADEKAANTKSTGRGSCFARPWSKVRIFALLSRFGTDRKRENIFSGYRRRWAKMGTDALFGSLNINLRYSGLRLH